MFNLCVVVLTIWAVGATVKSEPLPAGQPKAIVVAIILGDEGLKGLAGYSSIKTSASQQDCDPVACLPLPHK